jgi:hypothetical protein
VSRLDTAGIESEMMAEWRRRSRNIRYQSDPVAWLWDVLGKRWWSKQEEIAWSFVDNEFTLVKSANGVGKTQLAGDLVTWWVSVFPPTETTALVSAPVRNQIDENLFGYLRANLNTARERDMPLIGEITRWPKWVIHDPYDHDLVLPKRPADQNLLSSFQGIHRDHVAVVLDEAGGLQKDFYIAANAVTTNDHARIFGIGNPDMRNTEFHNLFKTLGTPDVLVNPDTLSEAELREALETGTHYYDDQRQLWQYGDPNRHWKRFTISAYDLPSFTGEVVYEDPAAQDKFVKRLTKPSWAAMMKRSASEGVVKAKVYGEFPGETDNSFFTQLSINKAWETYSFLKTLHEAGEAPRNRARRLGVDVAFAGSDKNVIRLYDGGLITAIDKWGIEEGEAAVEDMAIARRVHRWAQDLGVSEVRIDAAGTSRGVHSNLKSEHEFMSRSYALIGIVGSKAAPEPKRFLNARAWHYFQFREGMTNGVIGLDPTDVELRTDLEVMTYVYTLQQKLQITSKNDLKKDLKRSPDDLDAAIYAAIDLSGVTDGPLAGLAPGDTVSIDPWEYEISLAGLPM